MGDELTITDYEMWSADLGIGHVGVGSVTFSDGTSRPVLTTGLTAGIDSPIEFSYTSYSGAFSVDQLTGFGVQAGLNLGVGIDVVFPVSNSLLEEGPFMQGSGGFQIGADVHLTYTAIAGLEPQPFPEKTFADFEGIPLDPTGYLDVTVSHRGLANPKLYEAPPKPDSLGIAYDQGKAYIDKGVVKSGSGGTVAVVDKSTPSGGSKNDSGNKVTLKGDDGGKTLGGSSGSDGYSKPKDDGGNFNGGSSGSVGKSLDKSGSSSPASSASSGKTETKSGSTSSGKTDSKSGSSSTGKSESKSAPSKSAKPIVLDLDGDGFWERTAWAAADDGFLVIDLNADGTRGAGDGQIDQRSELVLSDWGPEGATDLQALAEATDEEGNLLFDTNGDGVLDANDTSYGEFRGWQDLDQDGEVDEGELRTLAEAGISQINLPYGTAEAAVRLAPTHHQDQQDNRQDRRENISTDWRCAA